MLSKGRWRRAVIEITRSDSFGELTSNPPQVANQSQSTFNRSQTAIKAIGDFLVRVAFHLHQRQLLHFIIGQQCKQSVELFSCTRCKLGRGLLADHSIDASKFFINSFKN